MYTQTSRMSAGHLCAIALSNNSFVGNIMRELVVPITFGCNTRQFRRSALATIHDKCQVPTYRLVSG